MTKKRLVNNFLLIFLLTLIIYVVNDYSFWHRWFSQPKAEDILTNYSWYSPVEKISDELKPPVEKATEGEKTISQTALNKAEAYARQFDSIAFLVVRNGRTELEAYKDGYNHRTIIDSQSMHKGLLGIATIIALDQKLIDLDTPVAKYIPKWAKDERQNITVEHLLNMSSGLSQIPYDTHPFSAGQRLFFGEHLDKMIANLALSSKPGEYFDFNHANSQALHSVITGAAKMSYAAFIRKYLWVPLNNGFAQVRLDKDNGTAKTFCCIQMRPMSWIRLGMMIVNGGKSEGSQVISKNWIEKLSQGTRQNPNFGYHVWLGSPYLGTRLISEPSKKRRPVSSKFLANDVIYIEGRGGQRLYIIPSKDLVVYRAGRIDFSWDDAKIINILINGIRPLSKSLTNSGV